MKYLKLILVAFAFLAGVTTIILGGLYFYRSSEKKIFTKADRKGTQGSYLQLAEGITHYEMAGPDTGQVAILLSGFSVPYYMWDGTFEYLAKNNYHTLRYDYWGRGYSDRPVLTYNKTLYTKQIIQLIQQLHLKTPVNLIGVSFGGLLATDFAIQYPEMVKKVIMIDPVFEHLKPDQPELLSRYYETTHPNERAESQLLDFKYPDQHPDWVSKYRVQMRYKGFIHALLSTMYNYNVTSPQNYLELNNTHKPVLLIWGRDDKTVPFLFSDSVKKYLKKQFYPVDDAGHLPFIEQAADVNKRMLDFLNN